MNLTDFILILIPVVAAAIFGAVITVNLRPGPMIVSAVQHFAAGVVFAAAAGEILPGLKHPGATLPVLIGGALGVLVMLAVKELEGRGKGPVGLMTAVGVDMLIDGLVLVD